MPTYDAIVVGTGPAGASTAYELSMSGLRVLMLERAVLPRYKTCGGGIPYRFFQTLPARVQQTLETVLTKAIFLGPREKQFITGDDTRLAGVMRDRFDYEFAMAAVDRGAELRDSTAVVTIEEQPDRVRVQTTHGAVTGRFLVGADGLTGVVRRSSRIGQGIGQAPALEVEVRRQTTREDLTRVHFTFIRDGYAWDFPKGDIHSVGLLSFDRDRARVKQKLEEWASLCGYSLEGQLVHGHPIPVWKGKTELATNRVLLAGDAAGTVDPLGGEGIRYAIMSGRIAAGCIREALGQGRLLSGYTEAIYEEIHRDFVYARRLARLFYRFPAFSFHMWVRSPAAMRSVSSILDGRSRYRDLFNLAVAKLFFPQSYLRLLG
jgi:geranylgeranyl reductase family protein